MKNHPIVIGLKVMCNGVFSFGWFAIAMAIAWRIADATGWMAALYFVLFTACTAYGIWCLYELGIKTIKNAKKG